LRIRSAHFPENFEQFSGSNVFLVIDGWGDHWDGLVAFFSRFWVIECVCDEGDHAYRCRKKEKRKWDGERGREGERERESGRALDGVCLV
jgi:hypothetical protein